MKMKLWAPIAMSAVAMLAANSAAAQSVALATPTYTQNFDTLPSTGRWGQLPEGWAAVTSVNNGFPTQGFNTGTGTNTEGNLYSFGTTADRALGSVGSNGTGSIAYGAFFTNTTGSTITGFDFGYVGEQWRAANPTAQSLQFSYSLTATGISASPTDTTWTRVAALDFTGPIASTAGQLNGNLTNNRTALETLIGGLSIANGSSFAFRWVDLNDTGADSALAIDDVSFTAILEPTVGAVPEPATWAMMIFGFGVVGAGVRRRRVRVAFA